MAAKNRETTFARLFTNLVIDYMHDVRSNIRPTTTPLQTLLLKSSEKVLKIVDFQNFSELFFRTFQNFSEVL